MQPRDYIPVLRKRWPLILGVVLLSVVASFLFTRLQTPIYRATAYLTVTPSRIGDYGQAMAVENLLRQYARRLHTTQMADEVNRRLNLDLPAERLRAKTKVSAVSEDLLLMLEVDDTDANRARDIAFAWADEFAKAQANDMAAMDPRDRIETGLLDRPEPAVLNWPKRNQIMVAAALLGLLGGTLLAFLLEFLDDTVKSPDDVDRFVGVPLLATVPANGMVTSRPGSANGHTRARIPALPRAQS